MELKRQNGGRGPGGGAGARSGLAQLARAPGPAGPHSSPPRQGARLGAGWGVDGVGGGGPSQEAPPLSLLALPFFSLSRTLTLSLFPLLSQIMSLPLYNLFIRAERSQY